jgi:hypothetical protein
LEHSHRPTLEDYVHRATRLGSSRSLNLRIGITRLFEDPERTLCWFSDDQIAQGLTYLVVTSASGDNGWLSAMEVPGEARVRCIEAIGKLFDRLFAPRCTRHLSHLSEVAAGTLNCVCYMWWDEFPCIALPGDPNLRRISGTALTTMEHILGLGSVACQESALHGLGHWQRQHASEVARIIDAFVLSKRSWIRGFSRMPTRRDVAAYCDAIGRKLGAARQIAELNADLVPRR